MGISDKFDEGISWPADYANADDAKMSANPPFVRLRLFNATIRDCKFSRANAPAGVGHFMAARTTSALATKSIRISTSNGFPSMLRGASG
jgi:hypothetical protein